MKDTKNIVYLAIYLALTIGLDFVKSFIPFLNMPSGGSINIALIPITICSFHLGYQKGLILGFMWFVLSSLIGLNNYFVSFGQIIFDYIIPSIILGLSSIFYNNKKIINAELGIFLMMFIRTLSICFSGAYYWYNESEVALSQNAWLFSLGYNLPYSIATTIMLLIVVPILLKSLKKYLYN